MALLNKFFSHLGHKRTCPDANKWVKPQFNQSQIRLIVFVENDIKGRILLFDSKAIKRIDELPKTCALQAKFLLKPKPCSPDNGKVPRYKIIKAGSDVKVLEEMMFGSVAMSYKGRAQKVHSIKTPPQLMLTKVFVPEKHKEVINESDGALESSVLANSSCDLSSPKHILRTNNPSTPIAHSYPVDVPLPSSYSPSPVHDSGIASSYTSSGSFAANFASSSSSSVSLSTSSLNSLQRRLQRNQSTSIETYLKCRSSVEHGKAVATGARHRKDKIGIGILVHGEGDVHDDSFRQFQKFFFSHITLFEGRVAKLEAAVERGFYSKSNFIHIVMQGFEVFQREVYDLYTTPRLSQPVWLNMVSYTNYRYVLCEQFMKELMAFYKYDTKATHFFVSSVITAVLRYHLAWVPTVTPGGGTPSHAYLDKHTAKWLDTLSKTHPYNPLWAQLGDVYGAVGHPQCLSRTIVIGKKSELVNKLLYILSYFIRCSEVHGSSDTTSMLSNLHNVEFEQNTIFFDTSTPKREFLSRCTSIDGGVDVTNAKFIPKSVNSDTNSLLGSGKTMSNSGSVIGSVKSNGSNKVCGTLTKEANLDKVMKKIDKMDNKTDDILKVLCGNSAASQCVMNEEVERLICEETAALKNSPGQALGKRNGVVNLTGKIDVTKYANWDSFNLENKIDDRTKLPAKSSERKIISCDTNSKLVTSHNTINNQTIRDDFCKLSTENITEDVKVINVRHVGRDSSLLSTSTQSPVTSPKSPRSLLSDQLARSAEKIDAHDSGFCEVKMSDLAVDGGPLSPKLSTTTTDKSYSDSDLFNSKEYVHVSLAKCDKLNKNSMKNCDNLNSAQTFKTVDQICANKTTQPNHFTSNYADRFHTFDDYITDSSETDNENIIDSRLIPPPLLVNPQNFRQNYINRSTDMMVNRSSDASGNRCSDRDVNRSSDASISQSSDVLVNQCGDMTKNRTSDTSVNQSSDMLVNQFSDTAVNRSSDSLVNQSSEMLVNRCSDMTTNRSKTLINQSSDMLVNRSSDTCINCRTDLLVNRSSELVNRSCDVCINQFSDASITRSSDVSIGRLSETSVNRSSDMSDDYLDYTREPKNDATKDEPPCIQLDHAPCTCRPNMHDIHKCIGITRSFARQDSEDTFGSKSCDTSRLDGCERLRQDGRERLRNFSTHSRSRTPTDSPQRHLSGTPSSDSELDPLQNCTEIYLPQLQQAAQTPHRVQPFDQNLGRSLMAGFSDHYLPDFVLHGTSDPAIHSKVSADLASSVQQSVLDESVSEAIAVIADTDKWQVSVLSSRVTSDPQASTGWVASSLVCNLLESVHNLWKLKMSPEFCIMHLEDRLQEIYFKSRIFVEYIQSNRTASLDQLCTMLRLDTSDLPLLLAISTTHVYPSSSRPRTDTETLDPS